MLLLALLAWTWTVRLIESMKTPLLLTPLACVVLTTVLTVVLITLLGSITLIPIPGRKLIMHLVL